MVHEAGRDRVVDADAGTASRPPKRRQDNIDLLRAVAILSVMLYHFTARFPPAFYHAERMPFTFAHGNLGVDLFFVVSGYCIFMTLDSSRSLENFWARRLARIQPAYMAAIVTTFTIVHLVGLPGREDGAAVALSNMLWFNLVPNWPMIDPVYWSLAVELKFYVWIGLIYYLTAGRNISLAWVVLALAGMLLDNAGGVYREIGTHVMIGPYAPAFLAGLIAWEWDRIRPLTAVCLAATCAALLLSSPRFAALPLLGVAIGAFGFAVLRMRNLKVPTPITAIGLISYSLYLIHQDIGYVLLRAIPVGIGLRLPIVFLLLIGLATVMYCTVERRWERPMQRLAERVIGSGRRSLRLPQRRIFHASITEEMRAW